MKAEIDSNGRLTITSETELESFALKCWSDLNLEVVEDEGTCMLKTTEFFLIDASSVKE